MSKRLENAFRKFADYSSGEYKNLNGDHRHFSLLILKYKYRRNNITLVGTWHIGRDRGAKESIIKGIKSQAAAYFKETRPDNRILMVEGFSEGVPICRDTLKKSFDMGEPAGVTFLAKEKRAKVISPEPAMRDQIKRLSSLGFSRYQIILHYVVRRMPWEITSQDLNNHTITYIARLVKQSGYKIPNENYVLNHVIPKLNYEMTRLNGRSLFRLKGNLIFPNYSSDELYPLTDPTLPTVNPKKSILLNEIAYNVNNIRDKNIIKEIDKALISNKSPFAVYGRSHFARIKPAMDYLYGRPVKVVV